MRIAFSVIVQNEWNLQSIDIKIAFLQGDNITQDVYIKPPREAFCNENVVWKFKKCIYDLAHASLKWYEWIKKFLFNNNGKVFHLDPALFILKNKNDLHGFIIVHVNDSLYTRNDFFNQNVVKNFKSSFSIGTEEE